MVQKSKTRGSKFHMQDLLEMISKRQTCMSLTYQGTTEKKTWKGFFSVYGTIVSKNLLFDKISGAQRGVAFVRFDRREEAQRAIQSLNGRIPEGGRDPMNVKIAEEHGKQKAAQYTPWQPDMPQSRGRGDNFRGMRGFPMRGNAMVPGRGNMRGGFNNEAFNNNLVSYPLRGYGGFGPLRQDKMQQRYNPMTSGMQSNGHNFF